MIERSATVSQEPYYSLVRFAAARQFDATSAKVFSIRLGITFTEEWETELMLHFVRAAITTSLLRAAPTNMSAPHLLTWIMDVQAEVPTPLERGEIVTELVGASTGPGNAPRRAAASANDRRNQDRDEDISEDEDTILVIGPWRYRGRGHSPAAIYARTIACDLAENRRLCRQMKGTSDDN